MKQLLLAALVLSAVSCSTDTDIKYHRVRTEVQIPDVNIEPGGDVQYLAYCTDEERALSDWMDSRSAAESKAHEYTSEHPDRKYTILWRQKPGGRLIPKHPRG
ncbi:MAG: hypothetical protein HY293_15505 [Planctomycetes bacterium]|nr:hypothetical protein [Planctomycetota bacterium]